MRLTIEILFVLTMLLLVVGSVSAQEPEWEWLIQAGGNGRDYAHDIATDYLGNSYIVGCFEDTLFCGVDFIVSEGYSDIIVAKINSDGLLEWISQASGSGTNSGISIVLDDLGNSYVTGFFSGTATFSSYSVSSISDLDIFVAKLDAEGNWEWVTHAGGYGMCIGISLTIDELNNLYVTGRYQDSITFGPYTIPNSSIGYSSDTFVAKLNSSGNWLWAVHAEGENNDYGYAISIDTDGDVLLTGSFELTTTFGAFELQSQGESDIYVAKISSDGIWLWAVQAGGESYDTGLDITISDTNIIGLVGKFTNSATFGNETVYGLGGTDIFVSTLDSDGNWLSALQAGGRGLDRGKAIVLDDDSNAYITGNFDETAYFDPFSLIGNMEYDIFLAKKDIYDNWEWAISAGGSGYDRGYGIALDSLGDIYLAGSFRYSSTFGPFELTSNGQSDIFIAKLSNPVYAEDDLILPNISFSNYPNPFNPETTISFNLPEESNIKLSIYNIKGQKIKQLISAQLSAGQHSVVWDGKDSNSKNVASGLYFYKLRINDETELMKKCMLMK